MQVEFIGDSSSALLQRSSLHSVITMPSESEDQKKVPGGPSSQLNLSAVHGTPKASNVSSPALIAAVGATTPPDAVVSNASLPQISSLNSSSNEVAALLQTAGVLSGFVVARAPAPLANGSIESAQNATVLLGNVSAPLVQLSAPATGIPTTSALYDIVGDGYCAVNHAWTPGDHGCEYVETLDACREAASWLGLLDGVNRTVGLRPAPLTLSQRVPRGCILSGSDNVAVFTPGFGTAPCDAKTRCICDCHSRRGAYGSSGTATPPPPEHVALLVAILVFLIATLTTAQRVPRSVVSGIFPVIIRAVA